MNRTASLVRQRAEVAVEPPATPAPPAAAAATRGREARYECGFVARLLMWATRNSR